MPSSARAEGEAPGCLRAMRTRKTPGRMRKRSGGSSTTASPSMPAGMGRSASTSNAGADHSRHGRCSDRPPSPCREGAPTTGVHYPGDVLAGALAGTGLALLVTHTRPRSARTRHLALAPSRRPGLSAAVDDEAVADQHVVEEHAHRPSDGGARASTRCLDMPKNGSAMRSAIAFARQRPVSAATRPEATASCRAR